jgi:hypothetical protein
LPLRYFHYWLFSLLIISFHYFRFDIDISPLLLFHLDSHYWLLIIDVLRWYCRHYWFIIIFDFILLRYWYFIIDWYFIDYYWLFHYYFVDDISIMPLITFITPFWLLIIDIIIDIIDDISLTLILLRLAFIWLRYLIFRYIFAILRHLLFSDILPLHIDLRYYFRYAIIFAITPLRHWYMIAIDIIDLLHIDIDAIDISLLILLRWYYWYYCWYYWYWYYAIITWHAIIDRYWYIIIEDIIIIAYYDIDRQPDH